ncbi:MAG TPA: hypothetical protein DEA43_03695 [Candidatus Moranbacteria bacterium]|nr:hypothetical protein [Candidatus Moranbacteria bacterium]HBT45960.1 hypothetical protein [Candidatus Moranbacteria bacterium]
MKQKFYLIALFICFILLSLYLPPVSNFQCGFQRDGSHISCNNDAFKILLVAYDWLMALVFTVLLIVGLFLKDRTKKYIRVVSMFFCISIILKYLAFWYILYLDSMPL